MYTKYFGTPPLIFAAVLLISGCENKNSPNKLGCSQPKNQIEQQQCEPQKSTDNRIEPTKHPKNWLDYNKPQRVKP